MNMEDDRGTTILRRVAEYKPPRSWRTWLIGRPLQTADAPHQTIGKLIGLAVFASDALSSTAYATQEILLVLAIAGTAAISFAFPISIAIVLLLAVITFSYQQTIRAYPGGAGSYIVSRDNLGAIPSLVAAAALLTNYTLTVAVSISSSIAQVVSAFPLLFEYRVWISVSLVLFIMLVNLRGVKESGVAFAFPTYFFMTMMYITLGTGFVRLILGNLGSVVNPPHLEMISELEPISFYLLLRAFANGTTALTGTEAISDGVTAFKEPRSRNAAITLMMMSFILGSMLLCITYLAQYIRAVPAESETVISQIARTVFGERDTFYLLMIAGTTVILVMGANTAYADFPRVSAFAASDGFLPRQMTYRGSRLVFSRGIITLAVISSGLIILFQASVTRLLPLYAIGVFISFTLSQAAMARRWWKCGHMRPGEVIEERASTLKYENRWAPKMVINGFGALMTLLVTFIFAITKFTEGAWIVIIVIPALVAIFWSIHLHYKGLAQRLSLEHYGAPPRTSRHRVILALSGVHRGSLEALRYARMLSSDITAVHVSIDPIEAEKLRQKWEIWGDGYRLVILESPYRLLIEPLLEYIEEIDDQRQPNEVITIVVPQFIPKHVLSEALHARTADTLRRVLLNRKGIVITEVPYQVD